MAPGTLTRSLTRANLFDEDEAAREIKRNLWKHYRLFTPSSPEQRSWGQFLCLLFWVNLFMLPVDIFFSHNTSILEVTDPLDLAIDAFFIADFLMRFRISSKDEEKNEYITDLRSIAWRYLFRWAAFDFVGALPWHLMTGSRPLKILKLLRVSHLRRHRGRDSGKFVNLKRVTRVLVNFIILSHWVACSWWFIAVIETDLALFDKADQDDSGAVDEAEFVDMVGGTSSLTPSVARELFTGADAEGAGRLNYEKFTACLSDNHDLLQPYIAVHDDSWIQRIPKTKANSDLALALSKHSPFEQQYISSLYWAFTALVKIPWVSPHTVGEKTFASIVVMIGAVFFAVLLGAIVTALNAYERQNALRRDSMSLMHQFANKRRLTAKRKSEMTRYVDAMITFNSRIEGLDKLEMHLSGNLRKELLRIVYEPLLGACPLLNCLSGGAALLICQKLEPQICLGPYRDGSSKMPGSVLIEPYSIASHLFLLHKGALRITMGVDQARRRSSIVGRAALRSLGSPGKKKGKERVAVVQKMGQFLGIYEPYEFRIRLPIQVKAEKHSQLFAIHRLWLIEVIERLPEDEADDLLAMLAKEQQNVLEALKVNRNPRHKPKNNPDAEIDALLTRMQRMGKLEQRPVSEMSAALDEDSELPGAGMDGSQGLAEKRKRSKPRRPSMTFDVGSLLASAGGDTDRSGVDISLGDSATASMHIWEDGVDSFMQSSQEVVHAAKHYEQLTFDFAKGTHSIEKLLAALTLIPESNRPRSTNGIMPPLKIEGSAAAKRSQIREGKSPLQGVSQSEPKATSEVGSESSAATPEQPGAQVGYGAESPGPGLPALSAVSPIEPPVASVRLLTGIQNMFSGFGPRQNDTLAITSTSPPPVVAQSARKFSRKSSQSEGHDKDPMADADGGSLSV